MCHPWVPGAASRWKSRPGPARVPVPPPRRVNVGCGPAEERVLLTGLHAVADIYCENCKTTLGWKYVSPRGPRDHGDSGPEKDGCRPSRWGRRPGGRGGCARRAGWARAEACGRDPVATLTADSSGVLSPHPRTLLGPSQEGGGSAWKARSQHQYTLPCPPPALSSTCDPEPREGGPCSPYLLNCPAEPTLSCTAEAPNA